MPENQNPHFGRSTSLYEEARRIIPGGTQLLSKRPELFAPGKWPAYYASAQGCEVVDLDGRKYLDFTPNSVGACLLGYAHPEVNRRVIERIHRGTMCTLNSPEDVELAKALLKIHPWAEQVRFARSGGEALAIAVRLARAATGRDQVAFCGYHGWCDWYLAANLGEESALDGHLLPGLSPKGVPRGLNQTALPFAYNQLQELQQIVQTRKGQLAAVVMEPTRSHSPEKGFLEGVRQLCDEHGIRLIFDEVTTGFRFRLDGIHLDYGIVPDVAVFAKGMESGHPIAAIIGHRSTMEAAEESFISSTYWTEGVGPTAALATISICQDQDVAGHIRMIGQLFQSSLSSAAAKVGVPFLVDGHPALTKIGISHPEQDALMTLFTIRMLERGFLVGSGFYPTSAHQPHHVEDFVQSATAVLNELVVAMENHDVMQRIGGQVRQTGFKRLI
ncbi:aminotransferase class III-fold pyridoxal phosphate-dependent enzyme [Planctomicrobium sp. SH661]|uniref:aminotransferase class III-fold pyridoxal phosphate-dependent enzyme n=1 Tax=Planctomicrobium sp. SH661 TaxID=3448124 RepID=UPI003F5B2E25